MPAQADFATVAADLKAAFGDAAILCVQAEEARTPPRPCAIATIACPLCQFHCGAHAALILPTFAGAADADRGRRSSAGPRAAALLLKPPAPPPSRSRARPSTPDLNLRRAALPRRALPFLSAFEAIFL